MKCFERLIESNFLANVRSELELARDVIAKDDEVEAGFKVYGLDPKSRKLSYKTLVSKYNLIEAIKESIKDDSDLLYFIKIEHIVFAFSRKKAQIEDAIRHSYNLNGDLPFFRSKHKIQGNTFHTMVIDTRFSFTPMSPN